MENSKEKPHKTKRRTPCPKGTRLDKKTGNCLPYNKTIKKPKSISPAAAIASAAATASASAAPAKPAVDTVADIVARIFATKPAATAPAVTAVDKPAVAKPAVTAPAEEPPLKPTETIKKNTRKAPCPRGTRYDIKTGACIPNNKTQKNTHAKAPAPSVAAQASVAQAQQSQAPSVAQAQQSQAPSVAAAQQSEAPESAAPAEPASAASAAEPEPTETNLNKQKREQEILERKDLKLNSDDYDFLYPSLNDPDFNIKIAERKEFNDNPYDGEINTDIVSHANTLCNADFELAPHQIFIRNFLSFQTPYNSLLLYHGLGSGKTCSAISVAEEMRDYVIQMGITSQIFIVASPNVQENFKVQLFDERKLKLIEGMWNIRSCTGNKFLKEINPMIMKGLSREKVITQINRLINTYYQFFGYLAFANYIQKKGDVSDLTITDNKKIKVEKQRRLKKEFTNRLIIIDEVHNIRVTDDNKDKRVANDLMELIENVPTIRLLLLSATPMFNSFKEIIWLVNLMNANDRRSTIDVKDVFNKDGSFKAVAGKESGKDLLERKATGYISFVRGENPYTFPFRLWPKEFSPENTFPQKPQPEKQLNGVSPLEKDKQIKHLCLFLTEIGEYQKRGYTYIMQKVTPAQMPSLDNIEAEAFGYTTLQQPIEGLNIIYPDERLDTEENPMFDSIELVGSGGLKRIMSFDEDPTTHFRSNFKYKPTKYKNIFSPDEIGKYSAKIKTICERLSKAEGVILIYSQYIDGGLVPIALALEEMGFSRSGGKKSLFDKAPAKLNGKKYVMITGDKSFSPNPANDIKMATDAANKDGKNVTVVLISQTGAEGLDLKFIRQVHILEPWYNMNRIEQIIGRAVRTCSHKDLPFAKRNVEIYLYASLNESENDEPTIETADLYLYRLAEVKAIQIGKISRVIKEISIDCILNKSQNNFTEENMTSSGVLPVTLSLASGGELKDYKIGDKPFSAICDYMESCSYSCRPDKEINPDEANMDTYNEDFIMMNTDKLILRIKQMMKERFFYRKKEIIDFLQLTKNYPLIQINAALQQLTEDKTEYITDKYGRAGNLVNISDLYLFQPVELNNKKISLFERTVPLDVKHNSVSIDLQKDIQLNKTLLEAAPAPAPAPEVEEADVKLYTDILQKYGMAIKKQNIQNGEKNWYMLYNSSIEIIKKKEKVYQDLNENKKLIINYRIFNYIIAQHIVDELSVADLIFILNEIDENPEKYNLPDEKLKTSAYVFKHIKTYITSQIFDGKKGIKGFLWHDKNKLEVIVKHTDEKWHIAESEDMKDIEDIKTSRGTKIKTSMNKIIGFINNFKKEDYVVFKTKDTTNPKDLGHRCDQRSMKDVSIELLNSIINEAMEKKVNMYIFNPVEDKDFWQKKICIIQEIYMRSFDYDKKLKKRWFLSPPDAALINIEKFPEKEKKKKNVKK